MELLGINNNNINNYNIEINKTIKLNTHKNINYKIKKDNNEILLISDFILYNKNSFIKLNLILTNQNNIKNCYIIHGNIKNDSYIETSKEYLLDKKLYNKFIEKFNFIDNTSHLNNFLYILLQNNFTIENYIDKILENKLLEKCSVTDYIIITRYLLKTDKKNECENDNFLLMFLRTLFVKCDFVNSALLNNNKNYINIISFETNEYDFNENDKILTIKLNNNIQETMHFLISNINKFKTFIKNIEEYKPVIFDEIDNKKKNKCNSENCCGGTCGKEPSEKKEESTDEYCSKKKSCKDTEGCCSNKADSECCKKNPEISCNCEKETDKEIGKESENVKELPDFIKNNKGLLLFMKGTKDEPKCKFSRTTVEKLNENNIEYNTFNIIDDSILREDLKVHCKTFPQMWKDSEFFCNGDTIKESENVKELFQII